MKDQNLSPDSKNKAGICNLTASIPYSTVGSKQYRKIEKKWVKGMQVEEENWFWFTDYAMLCVENPGKSTKAITTNQWDQQGHAIGD